jgi:hypothetical protein
MSHRNGIGRSPDIVHSFLNIDKDKDYFRLKKIITQVGEKWNIFNDLYKKISIF